MSQADAPTLPEGDPEAAARAVIDANAYMVLATADADGQPWATPVWFAHDDLRAFLWVSRPQRRHSANVAVRPRIAITVFDSTVPIGGAAAVYAEADAAQVGADGLEPALAIYSERSERHGGRAWTTADVTGAAPLRLYRAEVVALYVLDSSEERVPVSL